MLDFLFVTHNLLKVWQIILGVWVCIFVDSHREFDGVKFFVNVQKVLPNFKQICSNYRIQKNRVSKSTNFVESS
jgi:hypothetical protein